MQIARLRFYPKTANNGSPVLSCRFARKHICGLSLNYYELHQESLHCHLLGGRQRIVEVRTISQWSRSSRIIERDPPILSVSKVFRLRHLMGEIFVRKLVHLDTDLFISIMFELRCTKFRIVHKTTADPLKMPLDACLSQIMSNKMVSLFCGFPRSVAMKSSLLKDIILN